MGCDIGQPLRTLPTHTITFGQLITECFFFWVMCTVPQFTIPLLIEYLTVTL